MPPASPSSRRSALRRFLLEDEHAGAATIEFTIWIPIFFMILALAIDVCTLMLSQVLMYETASDTARRWAEGQITSESAAETYAATNGTLRGTQPDVTGTSSDASTVTVSLSFPMQSVAVVGILGVLTQGDLEVTVVRPKIWPDAASKALGKTSPAMTSFGRYGPIEGGRE